MAIAWLDLKAPMELIQREGQLQVIAECHEALEVTVKAIKLTTGFNLAPGTSM